MFRRVERTMDPDPIFRPDLFELGFFVNRLGQVRMLEAPDQPFTYNTSNNERVNEIRREAMHECFRAETEMRLSALGIHKVYLPSYTTTKPDEPYISILAPSPEVLKTRKRIIVLINDHNQDLGIHAYRQLQFEKGLNGGTVVDLAKDLIQRSHEDNSDVQVANIFDDGFKVNTEDDTPGLIVLSTGQLLYSHKHNKNMSMRSWLTMPRKSCMHDHHEIHQENSVAGHQSPIEHVKSVLNEVVYNADRVSSDAEIHVIAIASGAQNIVEVLEQDFTRYGSRIAAMALVESGLEEAQIKNAAVRAFLHQRSREWKSSNLSSDPHDCTQLPTDYHSYTKNFCASTTSSPRYVSWTEKIPATACMEGLSKPLKNLAVAYPSITHSNADSSGWLAGQSVICPIFAAGQSTRNEDVLTDRDVSHAILSFFEEVSQDVQHYCNPLFQTVSDKSHSKANDTLMLDQERSPVDDIEQLEPAGSPEQAELDAANAALREMSLALSACPADTPKVAKGREKLVERIATQKGKIQELEKIALAHGSLRATEAANERENWRSPVAGPQVKLAGTMVDSELIRAAGLPETADEALRERQSEVGCLSGAP